MVTSVDITHCLHPSHTLKMIYFQGEFTCDGCKSLGNGFRYRCSDKSSNCNFDLHEFCATCPSKLPILSSFMHPNHELKIHTPQDNSKASCFAWLFRCSSPKQHPTEDDNLRCHLCEDKINKNSGIFYTCRRCNFNVHPLCSQLPEHANNVAHNTTPSDNHQLTLRNSAGGRKCGVCGHTCQNWRYSCDLEQCQVDIHIKCITTNNTNTPKPATRSRWSISELLVKLGVAVASTALTGGSVTPGVNYLINAVANS